MLDYDFLEPSVQSSVFFDYLAEFFKCSGSDALHFPAGKGRLEHIGSVQASAGSTGSDYGVELIDEQDDVLSGRRFGYDGLETFLKIAPVLCAGNHGTHIYGIDALPLEGGRNVPGGNLERDAFHDCRFADSRLSHQHRVVLAASPEYLDYSGNLFLPSYKRVQTAFPGGFCDVEGELLQQRCFLFLRLILILLLLHLYASGLDSWLFRGGVFARVLLLFRRIVFQVWMLFELLADVVISDAKVLQEGASIRLGRAAQSQQKVVRGNLQTSFSGSFYDGETEDVLGISGEGYLLHVVVRNVLITE